MYGIAGIVVGARVYAQARILHKFGWGDAIMVLAMVCGSVSPSSPHYPTMLTKKGIVFCTSDHESGGSYLWFWKAFLLPPA
jgi:hypothetical protein